jgi:hypothetical protein
MDEFLFIQNLDEIPQMDEKTKNKKIFWQVWNGAKLAP